MPKIGPLVFFVWASLMVGLLGAYFNVSSIPTWYAGLNKPFFSPPSWIFAPVWIILYILMGIAAYRIWVKGVEKKGVDESLKLYTIQLVLNAIWSPVFFGEHNIGFAFIIIVFMLYFIYLTIRAFGKVDKLASYLLYPYIAWVGFATILNFSFWILNR